MYFCICVTCGAGPVHPYGWAKITPVFGGVRVAQCLVFLYCADILVYVFFLSWPHVWTTQNYFIGILGCSIIAIFDIGISVFQIHLILDNNIISIQDVTFLYNAKPS